MKKFLKFLLIVSIWVVIAAAILGIATVIEYDPFYHAVYLLVGIFVGWYGVKLTWKLIIRYRAKQRVQQLVNVEKTGDESFGFFKMLTSWNQYSDLDMRFKEIIRFFQASELKQHGDPLYVLPWYLVLGDANSDKEHLIKNSKLHAPTLDHESLHCDDGTAEWCLHNKGVFIDIPAKYSDKDSQTADPQWLELLQLLTKYRAEQPINGIVIAISAQTLLETSRDDLAKMGTRYRRLLEDCAQLTNVHVPVSLVVTRLDLLPGMNNIIAMLTEKQREEVIGKLNIGVEPAAELVGDVLDQLSRRLKQFMLVWIKQHQGNSDVLRLVDRLEKLNRPLKQFTEAAFEENVFQATPKVRGLYFSARFMAAEEKAPSSIFVKDLFTVILPRDRNTITALPWARRRQLLAMRHAFMIGGLATVLLATGLTYTYWTDIATLAEIDQFYRRAMDTGETYASQIGNLELYGQVIDKIQDNNFFPWYSLNKEPEFVTKLKVDFSRRVEQKLIAPIDQRFQGAMQKDGYRYSSVDEAVNYTGLLVRRINILKQFQNGADLAELEILPSAYDLTTITANEQSSLEKNNTATVGEGDAQVMDQEQVDTINKLYLQSLLWSRLDQTRKAEVTIAQLDEFRGVLAKLIGGSEKNLDWLVVWVNKDREAKSYRISDYWSIGGVDLPDDVEVSFAYTTKGKEKLDLFIDEIKNAIDGADEDVKSSLLTRIDVFYRNYKEDYYKNWGKFATNFHTGSSMLNGRSEWLTMANNLAGNRNIYFRVLSLIDEELKPYRDDPAAPDWVAMSNYYQQMLAYGPDKGPNNSKRNKVLTGLALKVIKSLGPVGAQIAGAAVAVNKEKTKIDKASVQKPTVDERMVQLEEASKLLDTYEKALADFVYNSEIRSISYDSVASMFNSPDNPAASKSAFGVAYGTVQKLQSLVGKPTKENEAFWSLYLGPLALMQDFMMQESNCYLNEFWNDNFLAELEGVPAEKRDEFIFGASGKLWPIIDTDFKPFVKRQNSTGYIPVKANGRNMAIRGEFLNYISKIKETSMLPTSYTIFLSGYPTSVNADSLALVSQVDIELNCPDGNFLMENKNFPVSGKFVWTPACGDTEVILHIGSTEIRKVFGGKYGFADFLRTMGTGHYRLRPDDFPEQKHALRESGVSYIDIQLDIDGGKALLDAISRRPVDVPAEVATCWQL